MTPQTVPRPQGTGRSGTTSGGGGGAGVDVVAAAAGGVGVGEEEEEEAAASTPRTSTSTSATMLSPFSGSFCALSPLSPTLEPSENPCESTALRSCDLYRFSRRRGGGKSGDGDANGDRSCNAAAEEEAIPFRLFGRGGGSHRTSASPVRAEDDTKEPYAVEAREEEEARRSQSGVTAAVAAPNNADIALCSRRKNENDEKKLINLSSPTRASVLSLFTFESGSEILFLPLCVPYTAAKI